MVLYTVLLKPYFQEKNKLENKMCDWVLLTDYLLVSPLTFKKQDGVCYTASFLSTKSITF